MAIVYTVFVLILILFICFIALMFTQAMKLKFLLDSTNGSINLSCLWLYPFLKIIIDAKDSRPVMTIYLFKMRIYKKALKLKKRNTGKTNYISYVKPENVDITASYGFSDPFATGIACGAISIVSGMLPKRSINQFPDFTATGDYIHVDATATLNVGSALLNMTQTKMKNK